MGLMDKLRDMFTEEVEDDVVEPIKKEVIQVEIPAPQQKEEVHEEVHEEVKKEEKAPAPVFFDDNDFANLEPPKKVREEKVVKKSVTSNRNRKNEPEKVEKKVFKPTPIISPVYGILDKNYHKEDIKLKNNYSSNAYYNHKDVSIDDVRKKAYGTLEDDLEVTLFGEPEKVDVTDTPDVDMFDELLDKNTNETVDDSDLFNLIDSMYEKEDDNNGNG